MDFTSKQSKVVVMTTTALDEASTLVEALVGKPKNDELLKQTFPRVARLVGVSERRIRAIWSGENRTIGGDELDALRKAVVKVAGERAVNETRSYADRIEAAAYALEAIDPDFHRPEIARLRALAGGLRNVLDNQG